jgi:hypothetical protein
VAVLAGAETVIVVATASIAHDPGTSMLHTIGSKIAAEDGWSRYRRGDGQASDGLDCNTGSRVTKAGFEMKPLRDLLLATVLVVTGTSTAYANDARCNKPPYGGSPDRYRAILEVYGQQLDRVKKTLEEICNMKFGGADRMALHKLGFTDHEIDITDTSTLAVDAMNGVKGPPLAK